MDGERHDEAETTFRFKVGCGGRRSRVRVAGVCRGLEGRPAESPGRGGELIDTSAPVSTDPSREGRVASRFVGDDDPTRAHEEAVGQRSRAREEAVIQQCRAHEEAVGTANHEDASTALPRAPDDRARVTPADTDRISAGFTASGSPSRAQRREARFQEAIRGLTYDTGRVELAEDWAAVRDERWEGESYEVLIQRGNDSLRADAFAAIEAFTLAVLIDPARVEGYRGLGRAMHHIHRVTCAIAAFNTALDIDPTATDGRFELGMALQMKGDFAEAAQAWGELVALDPAHGDGHARLAIALGFLADYEGAWAHVHAAESLGRAVPPQFRVLLASKFPEP